ncbi:MAG TPA: hypothetical protein GXX46_01595 [Peptococcaceae bacterium]|nr:hypothetical protein [Peptococcaceae bacterium]
MKLQKRTALIISFCLGLLLIATTALADIATKSGYEQLKDAVKTTAERCSTSLNSFTIDVSMVIKDNGAVLNSENSVSKYDMTQGIIEETNYSQNAKGESTSYYSYRDKSTDIRQHAGDEKYYVTEYAEENNPVVFHNPFAEDEAADIERIVDALVGSLRDQVMVEENEDGSKEIYGSLSEVQIPALINAITSFQVKQGFYYWNNNEKTRLVEDIYVKEVSGNAHVNADGLLESLLGTGIISGRDEQGNVHEITIDVLFNLSAINSTTITKPDLSGKEVVKQEGKVRPEPNFAIANPEKYIGPYSNDIIIVKDGRFVKIGERKLEITQLSDTNISGTYTEIYREGYEDYAVNKMEFTFSGSVERYSNNFEIEYTDASGTTNTGNIYIDEYNAKINLWLNKPFENLQYDPIFSPVLD